MNGFGVHSPEIVDLLRSRGVTQIRIPVSDLDTAIELRHRLHQLGDWKDVWLSVVYRTRDGRALKFKNKAELPADIEPNSAEILMNFALSEDDLLA